ncbi:hypothetical protein ZIOFF_019952 [Zingiber officinale]|uniref:Uncharacterized protein n=1 Tax=Zingiber officinale TaxID=94328 RepID=A0A8J5HSP3_ZINOF|nr:hypothetical protein ZIOFF_019952 [Zingiber officinale]
MEKDSSFSRGSEMSLLEQFEGILEGDKLIDEIGFLGPSQFASLDQDLSGSSLDQCTPIQLVDENSDHLLEDEILKHTKALLILSCNFSSAWNDSIFFHEFVLIYVIAASAAQIILGFSGLWRLVVRLLSPLSAAPLVALVGFGLYQHGFHAVAKCIEIGLPQLILLIILSQYIPHAMQSRKHVVELFALIISVGIVWLFALILTLGGAYRHAPRRTQLHCRTDRSGLIGASPWIRIPYPFQWGTPTFDAGEAFAMMVASFVALVESTGGFIAVSRLASATQVPPSVLSRGNWSFAGWDIWNTKRISTLGNWSLWIQDSRDQYTKERLDSVIDQYIKRLDSVTTVLF